VASVVLQAVAVVLPVAALVADRVVPAASMQVALPAAVTVDVVAVAAIAIVNATVVAVVLRTTPVSVAAKGGAAWATTTTIGRQLALRLP
jgi:hypothetical protein